MKTRIAVIAGAIASALIFSTSAYAQSRAAQNAQNDRGAYLGGSIGESDLDTTLKLFGGARAHALFGWEASLVNFGERERGGSFGTRTNVEAWALGGAVVGYLPFAPRFTGFGKLGAYYVKTRTETFTPGLGTSSNSDSDIEPGIGVGLQFRLNRQVAFRAELEHFGGEADNLISVGAQVHF